LIELNLSQLKELEYAIADMTGYIGDNSCSDKDCCGGPFYTIDQFDEGAKILAKYGLMFNGALKDDG
jgi:hypothetical protein